MIRVSIDETELKRQFRRYTLELNKEASSSIVDLAKVGATQLAYRVEPYGITAKAKGILERAIYKDVHKAYSTVGKTYADLKAINPRMAQAYGAAIKEGDNAKAKAIVERILPNYAGIETKNSGQHLEGLRNARGRVTASHPLNLTSKTELDRLKARYAQTAGIAKSGFLQAGESLGGKGRVQKWLKRGSGLGDSDIVRNGFKTVVTLYNRVRYASNVITESKQQAAIRNAYKNHLKRMEKQMAALASKV